MTLVSKPKSLNTSDVANLLIKYLNRIKENNPAYSNRAFSRDVGLSAAFTSDILKGKKALPFKHIETFIKVLDIDQSDSMWLKQNYLPVDLTPTKKKFNSSKKKSSWKLGTKAQLKMLTEWYYLPMIDLTTCKDFDGDFASALAITQSQQSEAIIELLKLGVIEKSNGKYIKSNFKLQFTSNKSRAEFRKYHSLMLKKSLLELENTNDDRFQQRLIIGFTLALNSHRIQVFKSELAELIYKTIDQISEDDDCNQIYHLGFQFFPISKKF